MGKQVLETCKKDLVQQQNNVLGASHTKGLYLQASGLSPSTKCLEQLITKYPPATISESWL